MTFIGALETSLPSFGSGGGINTNASFTTTHTFAKSNIWGRPMLQQVVVNDDDGAIEVFVSRFVDGQGAHNVHHIGDFVTNCTSITYKATMHNCVGRAVATTIFWKP